jgi:putative BNR repeat neuraminidase
MTHPMDNHGVGTIIADQYGFLHVFYGPHYNDPLLEAVSQNPWDASAFPSAKTAKLPTTSWTEMTTPSVARDGAGTLHLLHVGRNGPGSLEPLVYRSGTPGLSGQTIWQAPVALAAATGLGRTSIYSATIAVSRTGGTDTLHVAFQLWPDLTVTNAYTKAYAATRWAYLRSSNGGLTWLDWHGNFTTLPVTSGSTAFVEKNPLIDVRVCNIAIDPNGDPWISVFYLPNPAVHAIPFDTRLWRLSGGQWSSISLGAALAAAGLTSRVAFATITFDAQGVLYVAAELFDRGDTSADSATTANSAWYGKSKEVAVLMSTDLGQTFQIYPISPVDPTRPHWLANIERPTTSDPIPVPALLYTDGGFVPQVPNAPPPPPTDIVFVPLYKH